MLTSPKNSCASFEYALAYHCAPALAGIKPADLISWPEDCCALLERYQRMLAPSGVRLRCMGCRGGRRLLLLYRQNRLEEQLRAPEVRRLLSQAGYPAQGDLEALLEHLGERLGAQGDFPHEVGLFLGYPAEDVEGFCKNHGRNYKFSGLWKVYSDVERAKARLCRYDRCRRGLCRRLEADCRLGELFPATA